MLSRKFLRRKHRSSRGRTPSLESALTAPFRTVISPSLSHQPESNLQDYDEVDDAESVITTTCDDDYVRPTRPALWRFDALKKEDSINALSLPDLLFSVERSPSPLQSPKHSADFKRASTESPLLLRKFSKVNYYIKKTFHNNIAVYLKLVEKCLCRLLLLITIFTHNNI